MPLCFSTSAANASHVSGVSALTVKSSAMATAGFKVYHWQRRLDKNNFVKWVSGDDAPPMVSEVEALITKYLVRLLQLAVAARGIGAVGACRNASRTRSRAMAASGCP